MLGIVSSFVSDTQELPTNFDWIKLPLTTHANLFHNIPAHGSTPTTLSGVGALRQAIVEETLDAFAPRLLLTDFLPSGGHGELRSSLACLRAAEPRVALVLGLRDVIDSPENVRRTWRETGEFALMEQVYDRILVYGDPAVFDVAEEYDFTPGMRAKLTYCGYLHRPEPLTPPEVVRARLGVGAAPLVVVTTGGGHDGEGILRNYISALRRGYLSGVHTLMTTGPIRADARSARLAKLARNLPNLTMTPFVTDFLSYVNAADAVITMGGSAVVEIVSLGKRPIIVPRVKPWQEQLIRA
jgi:predicted glycosyltransferase